MERKICKFEKLLKRFLKSECYDYDINFSFEPMVAYGERGRAGTLYATVLLTRDDLECKVTFSYDDGGLIMQIGEDCWESVNEHSFTVRYFWIMVAPRLFPV